MIATEVDREDSESRGFKDGASIMLRCFPRQETLLHITSEPFESLTKYRW